MNNKHTAADLAQMQSLPLDAKIEMSLWRIKDFREHYDGKVYVSLSGKDSTVVKHLVDSLYDDVPSVYIDTGLEYPSVRLLVREIKDGKYPGFNSDVTIIRPSMRFDEVIKTYGYAVVSKEVSERVYYARRGAVWALEKINATTRYGQRRWLPLLDAPFGVGHRCCFVMKKEPAKRYERITGRVPILGILAGESSIRRQAWMRTGCNAFDAVRPKSTPIAFWTENDVLEYIKRNNVPIASAYGDVVETGQIIETACGQVAEYKTTECARTGCMFCLFGAHLEKGEGRFERMHRTHPKQYEYCMRSVESGGLGLKDVIDWMNANCGTDIKY